MTPLAKDEFAVRDRSGINVFKANGDFLKSLDNPKFGLLYGLAYDPGQDHILTINTNGMKNSRDNFSKVIINHINSADLKKYFFFSIFSSPAKVIFWFSIKRLEML